MKKGVPFLTITPDVLVVIFLPISATLGSASLEIFVPAGGMLPSGNTTMVPLN